MKSQSCLTDVENAASTALALQMTNQLLVYSVRWMNRPISAPLTLKSLLQLPSGKLLPRTAHRQQESMVNSIFTHFTLHLLYITGDSPYDMIFQTQGELFDVFIVSR